MELKDRVALITGGGNGIGRATAIAFAERGTDIVVADIDLAAAEKVRTEIEERGRRAVSIEADVSKEGNVEEVIRKTIDEMGGLDVLVSNAGVSVSGPVEAIPLEDWKWIVDVNLWAHIYAVRAALPYFLQRNSGHFVHVASAAGIFGAPGLVPYSVTKFAVFGLAESLAVSLHGTGIGVSVVCPLFVDTDIVHRGRITGDPAAGLDQEAIRKLGREMLRNAGIPPEKVGEAIVSGVEANRFLVLPHPEVLGIAQSKWADPEAHIERTASAMLAQRDFFTGR